MYNIFPQHIHYKRTLYIKNTFQHNQKYLSTVLPQGNGDKSLYLI